MKKTALGLGLAAAGFVLVVVGRAAGLDSKQLTVELTSPIDLDLTSAAERLASAVRIATVSTGEGPAQSEQFEALRAHLAASFPRVHEVLTLELVGGDSMLFTWTGTGDGDPVLLLGHLDVVPVMDTGEWTHPPFGGVVAEGHVWGRGTLDDKGACLAILEAVEGLLDAGFTPSRTVLLAFGHDEEIGGTGAKAIADLLASRKILPALVLDEGLAVTEGIVTGFDVPVALIGLAEKGYLTLHLTAKAVGGHSSMPPPKTAVGRVATAIDRLEQNPMPGSTQGVLEHMLDYLGPELPFGKRLAMGNRWLFEPILVGTFSKKNSTNALVRTTTAATMIEGGVKENVLPTWARATVNFRIRPGDTTADIEAHVNALVGDLDLEVVRAPGAMSSEPSPISSPDSDAFLWIHRSIAAVFPDAVVAPGLVVGATDARHFAGVSENIYRFTPWRLTEADIPRVHGRDERLSVDNYAEGIQFYATLIREATGAR